MTLTLFSLSSLSQKVLLFLVIFSSVQAFGDHQIQLSCFAEEKNETLSELIVTHLLSELIAERGLQASSPGIPLHLAASTHLFMVSARPPAGLCLVKKPNVLQGLTGAK